MLALNYLQKTFGVSEKEGEDRREMLLFVTRSNGTSSMLCTCSLVTSTIVEIILGQRRTWVSIVLW